MKKGVLYYTIASSIFTLSSYVIHVVLARYWSPEIYGRFGVVLSILMISYMILGNGFPKAISKYTAENKNLAGAIRKAGMKAQMILALSISLPYFLLAKQLAILLNDITLTGYFRLSVLNILSWGICFIYIGSLNGMRQFGKEATVTIISSILRVPLVFLLVFMGFQVYGAIWGLLLGILIGIGVGGYFCRGNSTEGEVDIIGLIKFSIPALSAFMGTELIMNIDLLFVKAILEDGAKAGFYTCAIMISKMVYFIFVAFSAILLPSISISMANNDLTLTKRYINQSLRYMLILLLPCTSIISASSKELISFLYTNVYIEGSLSSGIRIFGISFLIITLTLTVIMLAGGKQKVPMWVFTFLVPIDIMLNLLLIPSFGLEGAALATTGCALIGLVILSICVYKRFNTLINPLSIIRIGIACLVIYFLTTSFIVQETLLLGYYVILFIIYFILLIGLKEIKKDDFVMIKELFIRKQLQEG